MVVDLVAQWCVPCQRIALWLEDGNAQHLMTGQDPDTGADLYYPWYSSRLDSVPGRVQSGELRCVTILAQDSTGSAPTQDTLRAWTESFPSDNVAVLLDDGQRIAPWLGSTAFPVLNVLGADLRFETWTDRGVEDGFEYLSEEAP